MDVKSRLPKGRRERYLLEVEFPDAVEQKVRARHPELSDEDWARVEHGLREWLVICLHRRRREVGMPSRIVDDAWHELILNTIFYTRLCQRAYGRYLHHTPDSGMATPMPEALDDAVLAWDRSSLSRAQGEAAIWELDRELGVDQPFGLDFLARQEIRERPKRATGSSGAVYACSGGSCGGGGGGSCAGGGGGCGGGGGGGCGGGGGG